MQDGKQDIERGYFARARGIVLDHQCAALPAWQKSEVWSLLWHNQRRSTRSGTIARIGNNPATLSGYSDKRDLVALWIEGAKHVCGGCPRYIVLGGPTPEKDRNSSLSWRHRAAPVWP